MVDLTLKVTTPNNTLRKAIGDSDFSRITKETNSSYDNTCQCCGWKPKKEEGEDESQFEYKKKHLILHVVSYDEKNPLKSDVTTLCRSCYVVNHIDMGIEQGFVDLVNSRFTQRDLTRISWNDVSRNQIVGNNREGAKIDRAFIQIKRDPLEILEDIKEDHESEHLQMLKVVFTNKFLQK